MNMATHPSASAYEATHSAAPHGLFYRAVVFGTRLSPRRRAALYLGILTLSLALVWVPVTALLALTPPRYTSEWTLILPGAGSGHAVNLDSIGQATANTASPFANSSIDPVVNYKAIASSSPVIAQAAAAIGQRPSEFGAPRIKLVDQTSMIHFQVRGASAEEARAKSLALYQALQQQLETLREDEMSRITEAGLATIADFNAKLQRSQQQTLDYQAQTSIVSVEQFQQLVTRLEQERANERELAAGVASLRQRILSLQAALGIDEAIVDQVLTLRNDQLFQAQLARHAEIQAQINTVEASWGPNHPQFEQLHVAHDAINAALTRRGRLLSGNPDYSTRELIDLGSNLAEGGLLQDMVRLMADEQGQVGELTVMREGIAHLATRVDDGVDDALQLDDLSRRQQVATAVFSTALAKQDIGKVDRFASYPLLQMLAEPTLPDAPDSLHKKLAIAGGGGATLFIMMGLSILWIRKTLLQRLLKSARSGTH
ncbi:hypothetical protein [Onishia taeanensis]